jgi:hypothetical protein
MNTATASPCRLLTPCQHLYTFEITPSAEIRVEIENLPEAYVLVQYLTMPDWLRLITRLIDDGAEKI